MISYSELKRTLATPLLEQGFTKANTVLTYQGKDLAILIGFQKWDHGQSVFVNVGLLLKRLHSETPAKVELCDIVFRLESAYPEYRELIVDACSLNGSEQRDSLARFVDALRKQIMPSLISLTEDTLREQFQQGRFARALIRKEARSVLNE